MLNASSPGLALASAALITEILRALPHEKALEVMENAANALTTGRNKTVSSQRAANLIRGHWKKMIVA